MKPETFITFYDVSNGDNECIVHFLQKEKALEFMQTYGEEGWYCLERVFYFADDVELSQVYEDIMIETEGEWVSYETRL